jgi:hypothetical protein
MNDINTLRDMLFETMDGLRDPEKPLEIERAKAINDTAQVIINTAKVEIDYARTTGQIIASGFLPVGDKPASAEVVKLVNIKPDKPTLALPAEEVPYDDPDDDLDESDERALVRQQLTGHGVKTIKEVPGATITKHERR